MIIKFISTLILFALYIIKLSNAKEINFVLLAIFGILIQKLSSFLSIQSFIIDYDLIILISYFLLIILTMITLKIIQCLKLNVFKQNIRKLLIYSIMFIIFWTSCIYFFHFISIHLYNFDFISYIGENPSIPNAEALKSSKDHVTSMGKDFAIIIGSALGVFKTMKSINPRAGVIGGLATAGLGTGINFYHKALDNPEGFHAYMFGLFYFWKNGTWPTQSEILGQTQMVDWVKDKVEKQDESLVKKGVAIGIENDKKSFIGEEGDVLNLLKPFLKYVRDIYKPVPVEGFLDDLLAQQFLIFISLSIIAFSILFLLLVYIINVYFLLYKDSIQTNNKFLRFYLNYQSFFAKLALIYLPLLIGAGILVIIHGLHFLISHQIPLDNILKDLHIQVKN